jgi:hypothetical protein
MCGGAILAELIPTAPFVEEDMKVVQKEVAESTPFAFRASSNNKNPSAEGSRRRTGACGAGIRDPVKGVRVWLGTFPSVLDYDDAMRHLRRQGQAQLPLRDCRS